MKSVLLDTNIVIYLINEIPFADLYRASVEGTYPFISYITAAELDEGAFRAGWGSKTS